MSNYKSEIKQLIASGKTEQAILRLLEVKEKFDEDGVKQINIVSGRYYQWKNNSIIGINNNDIELRRVESAIHDILLDQRGEQKSKIPPSSRTKEKVKWAWLITIIGFLIVLLINWERLVFHKPSKPASNAGLSVVTTVEGDGNNNIHVGDNNFIVQTPDVKEPNINMKITNNSVGGIELGMTLEDVRKLYNIENGYLVNNYKGQANSDDVDCAGIYKGSEMNKNNLILLLGSWNKWTSITSITAINRNLTTATGMHPGMSISDYLSINSGDEMIHLNEMYLSEYFTPFDFNNGKYYMNVNIKGDEDDNTLGNYDHENPIETASFRKNGEVYSIEIGLINPAWQTND